MSWFAFTLGFLGSIHCVGMCGPLVLAVPFPRKMRWQGIVIYQVGRLLTYSILGLLMGYIGTLFVMGGIQRIFSLITGIILLVIVVAPFLSHRVDSIIQKSGLLRWVRHSISNQFKHKTLRSSFVVGSLNGLIPCGMVYMALIGSLAAANPISGSLFMISFGLGTVPALLILSGLKFFSFQKFNSRWVVPSFSFLIALLFIYRGIGIEIPDVDLVIRQTGLDQISICR